MMETLRPVNTPRSRPSLAGAHPPGGTGHCATRPHQVTAGSASQGVAVWQARPHGPAGNGRQIPVSTPAASGREVERKKRLGQRFIVLIVLATVILVDQATKWWAWRHVSGVHINPGGDFLTGPTIGRWYADPVTGALLDLADCGLVSIAAGILARWQRQATVTVCGSLMVGGWASNLLDRLGMHYWTAPGSIRGAVDFISIGGRSWNLADFCIIGATPLFLLAGAQRAKRPANQPGASPARRGSPRGRVLAVAVAGAALIMTVALGAAHYGTLMKPSHTRVPKLSSGTPNRKRAWRLAILTLVREKPFRTAVRR
jgi:lipoprotein signal peptidase